jgi:hypothetical protein
MYDARAPQDDGHGLLRADSTPCGFHVIAKYSRIAIERRGALRINYPERNWPI